MSTDQYDPTPETIMTAQGWLPRGATYELARRVLRAALQATGKEGYGELTLYELDVALKVLTGGFVGDPEST